MQAHVNEDGLVKELRTSSEEAQRLFDDLYDWAQDNWRRPGVEDTEDGARFYSQLAEGTETAHVIER